ncbi:MAG: hypothetical protein RR661_02990 [Anaerovoracaceae bacterium]
MIRCTHEADIGQDKKEVNQLLVRGDKTMTTALWIAVGAAILCAIVPIALGGKKKK